MPRLFGAQTMVLQAILDAQGETPVFVEDPDAARLPRYRSEDIRDWLLTLDQEEYVDLALTERGSAPPSRQRAAWRWDLTALFPRPPPVGPRTIQVPSRTGRERARSSGSAITRPRSPAARRRQRRPRDGGAPGFGQGPLPAQNVVRLTGRRSHFTEGYRSHRDDLRQCSTERCRVRLPSGAWCGRWR